MEIDFLAVVFRWLQISPAIIAVGGAIFMRFALVPSMSALPESQRPALQEAIRSRWSKWVMAAIAFLLVSGLYNFIMLNRRYQLPSPYHALFGIKFLLALAIFALASMVSGRSGAAVRMRENLRFWLSLNVGMAVILVCISGVMRNLSMNAPLKAEAPAAKSAPAAERESAADDLLRHGLPPGRGTALETVMDKKVKKRLDLLNTRLQKLRQQLAGAKKQMDEPDEVGRLEKELAEVTAEVEKLKTA